MPVLLKKIEKTQPRRILMSVVGKWNLVMKTPVGENKAELAIDEVNGGTVTGSLSADGQSEAIQKGTLNGDQLTFSADVARPMKLTVSFDLTLNGDVLEGKCKPGIFPAFAAAATRA
jgi:hypothetical protein